MSTDTALWAAALAGIVAAAAPVQPRLLLLRSNDLANDVVREAEDRTAAQYRQNGVEVDLRSLAEFERWLSSDGKHLARAESGLQLIAFADANAADAIGGFRTALLNAQEADVYGLSPGRYVHSWGYSLAACSYNNVVDAHRDITGMTIPLRVAGSAYGPWAIPVSVDRGSRRTDTSRAQRSVADRLIDQPLPELVAIDVEGREFSLTSLRGRIVVVDLWATWCPGCIEELPVQQMVREKYRSQGMELLTISADEDHGAWSKFIHRNQLGGVHVRAPDWIESIGVRSFPIVMVLDRTGTVRAVSRGNSLVQALEKVLQSN